jgi:HlyD family secretion protein
MSLARLFFWPSAAILVVSATVALWWYSQPRRHHQPVSAASNQKKDKESDPNEDADDLPETPNVRVVRARKGAMERVTVQAGSVEADEVHLHSMVTGILKSQSVLIGHRVKKNQILAVIDVPELEIQVQRNAAVVDQAKARVAQMEAKVDIAQADLEVAKAQITFAEFDARAAAANLSFRHKYFKRMEELNRIRSIEDAVVDEAMERYEAAREKENAAKAAIVSARSQVLSVEAKVKLARADVLEAQSQVKIAEAELGKSQVMLGYSQIPAPFDGIITQRTLYTGATVRALGDRGNQAPLLTIQRADVMRVVVQVPDSEARYADPDDTAYIEFDAFRGMKFDAKVSRIADSEDPLTRLMRVEIDLPNPQGKIRQGMFGKVTIVLDKERDKLSIPAGCLAHGKSSEVFILRDGKVTLTRIAIGLISNERVMVLNGIDFNDRIVLNPPNALRDGAEVNATEIDELGRKSDSMP